MFKIQYLAALALVASAALAQTDLTLKDREKGEKVVDVAVERCWQIFGYDFNFMKRCALVESHFGEDPNTYVTNTTGGIWKIRKGWYDLTNPGTTAMANVKATILSLFGVAWNSGQYEHMIKPLLSAFATRMWLMEVNEAIPNTLVGQASFWNRHIKSNESWTEADFIRIVSGWEEGKVPVPCNATMDMAIVLDGSGSIGAEDFNKVRNFTAELIKSYDIRQVRTGLVSYSSNSTRIFNFNHTMNAEQLQNTALNLPYLRAGTNTNEGIKDAVGMFRETPKREGAEEAPMVMVLVTDGQSNEGGDSDRGGVPEMANVSKMGIESFAVGVGSYYLPELLQIALNDSSRIFALEDFNALRSFFDNLNEKTCEAPQAPQIGAELDGALAQNEKRFYKLNIPEEGIRVYYTVGKGNFSAYAALGNLTNKPSEVVYDVQLTDDDKGIYFPYRAPGGRRRITPRAEENVLYIGLQGKEASNEFTLSTKSSVGVAQASIVVVAVMALLSRLY